MNLSFDPKDDTLKCGICNKPLSVPPVLHCALLGNICGRCEDKAISDEKNGDSKLERQRIYENIAKYLTFPCAYHVLGCTAELKWNSVQHHEDICEFKNIVCPLSHKNFQELCTWIGENTQLMAHIRNEHKKFFCNPPQTILTPNFGSKIMFWEITSRIVVVILDHQKNLNKYYCCISADLNSRDCQSYQYQVELCSNQWDNPCILRRSQLEPLYGNTFTRPDNSLDIDIDSIKHLFKKSNEIMVKFTIVKKINDVNQPTSTSLAANSTVSKLENIAINENLLHDLECPVCVEFMVPPIFICQAGHNVCSSCVTRITMCPICRGNMLGGRNYTLEKLTATVNYPCVNRERGCGYVAPLLEVKKHESNCLLMERECFVSNCPWKGSNIELLPHIEQEHATLEMNTVQTHQLQQKVDQYIIIFDNKIFLLKIKFSINQPFEYIVQCYGGEENEYKYELQIIGSSTIDIKITLGHVCEPLDYNSKERNIAQFTGMSVPFAFLSQFLTQFHQLEFKINICRVKE